MHSNTIWVVVLTGNTTVSPTTTISYNLTASNAHGSVNKAVTIHVGATPLPFILNEIEASNKDGLKDLNGDNLDWIELYNPNPYPIDELGWIFGIIAFTIC